MSKSGKVVLNGIEFDNPTDSPVPKRNYREWKETKGVSFKSIYLDRYLHENGSVSYEAWELTMSNRGKCLLDGVELKSKEDVSTAKEIFGSISVE